MISKRIRIEKNKYNNRYKIIYSTPYRQMYKYLKGLSPSYAKNFMKNIKYIKIDYDKETCEMLDSLGGYISLYNTIIYRDSHERILTHELTHMASTNIDSTTNYNTGIMTVSNNSFKKRNKGSILDEGIGIDWKIPVEKAILSEKDTKHPLLGDFESPFEYGMGLYKW